MRMPVSMGKEETDDDKRAPLAVCLHRTFVRDVAYTAQHLKIDLGFQSFRLQKVHDGTKQLRLEPEEWNEFKKILYKKRDFVISQKTSWND